MRLRHIEERCPIGIFIYIHNKTRNHFITMIKCNNYISINTRIFAQHQHKPPRIYVIHGIHHYITQIINFRSSFPVVAMCRPVSELFQNEYRTFICIREYRSSCGSKWSYLEHDHLRSRVPRGPAHTHGCMMIMWGNARTTTHTI